MQTINTETLEESFVGEECFYVDKVTHSKIFDGHPLGVCLREDIHSLHKLPILWFNKPFMGFKWVYKSTVKIKK